MTSTPIFCPEPDRHPDPEGRADRVCRFLRNLTLWEGEQAGQPFELHPFQEAIIRRIYGPSDEDGNRLARTVCLWIPRGNAKTTLAAGLGLVHLVGPESEPGGQVVMAAADRENAGIAFRAAHKFVEQNRTLASIVRPIESRKTLECPRSSSTLKAISSEAYSKHGLNVSYFLADEVHAWPPSEARKLFVTVNDSMVKRRNPLAVIISTAGEGTGTLASDLWLYSHKVASGEVEDPGFVPIILAAPADADWQDEAVWRMANPAINAGFLHVNELRSKARRIKHFPSEVAAFKRFHLNIWTEGVATPWMPLRVYDAAETRTPDDVLLGQPCWVGVDLSSVRDLTAVVAVFAVAGDGRGRCYDVLARFFLPEKGIERKAEEDAADYTRWADEGWLTLTPGDVVDHDAVADAIMDMAERYSVQEVALDRWNSTAMQTRLQSAGFTVNLFGQGFASMAAPIKELERALACGQFRHGGNPVLRMCFGNAVAETDAAENIKLTKAKARGRIDGAVASAMAVGRILAGDTGPSPYETVRDGEFLFV